MTCTGATGTSASAGRRWAGLIAAPLVAAAAQPLLEAALATRAVAAPTLDDLRRRTEELRAQGGRNPEVDSLLARLDDLLRRAAA